MNKVTQEEQKEELSQLDSSLKDVPRFIADHPQLTYIEFDYYTVHDLTLFSVEPDFDFASFKTVIDKIYSTLPSIKRVFSKPFIVLKDTSEVLPVEVVTKINQNTLAYLGNHASDVANITSKGIKPRRLLTQVYEDDYGIYENLVFCDFVDSVIHYCKKNLRALRHLLYASQTMDLNFLERVNHLDYYLALGKLHTGYVRDYEKYYVISKKLYKITLQILNTIKSRLIKPVYKNNKRRSQSLDLKKTNIFLMQKNYHQVYTCYKYLLNNDIAKKVEQKEVDEKALSQTYFYYVQILTIFALGHFNFKMDPNAEKMDLTKLDSVFSFKSWTIMVSNINNQGLLLTIAKELTYKIILVPYIGFEEDFSIFYNLKQTYQADELVICSPFESDYLESEEAYISIDNIDSFRRLQQIFLRGMIYSDTQRTVCPFCGEPLHYERKDGAYECENCRMVIKEATCFYGKEKYFYTEIYKLEIKETNLGIYSVDDRWIYNQRVESAMYFRNITKIDNKGRIICPICHLPKK